MTGGARRRGRGRRAAAALAGAALALGASAGAAGAGTVSSPAVATVQPNNDDAGAGNPNVIEVFGGLAALAPADLVITVAPSAGVTEYRVTAVLNNDTGADWIGFRVELGFGVGAEFVAAAGPGLDLDAPDQTPGPAAGAFATIEVGPGALRFSDGTVPVFFDGSFAFSLDVPDPDATVPVSALTADGYRFTLRFVPETPVAIPAPAAAVLLGAGGLLLAAAGARRRDPSA